MAEQNINQDWNKFLTIKKPGQLGNSSNIRMMSTDFM